MERAMDSDDDAASDRRMRATYARVLGLQVVVLVILWALGRYFSAA
jgi:hypothetical protein